MPVSKCNSNSWWKTRIRLVLIVASLVILCCGIGTAFRLLYDCRQWIEQSGGRYETAREWIEGTTRIPESVASVLSESDFHKFDNVVWVDLSSTGICDDDLERIGQLPYLTHLRLNNTAITDASLQHLSELEELKTIELCDSKVTGTGLSHLRCCRSLEVDLRGCQLSMAGVDELARLPNLALLSVARSNLNDEMLRRLSASKTISVISCDRTKVTADGLRDLARMPKLSSLYLGSLPLSDDDLIALSTLPRIEAFALWSPKISGSGLLRLRGLSHCKDLTLCNTKIDDKSLAAIVPMIAATVKYLDLTGTRSVTDKGLSHLAKCKNLELLYLEGAAVTDAGVKHLSTLTKLWALRLNDTQIGDAGVTTLLRALPNLTQFGIQGTEITDDCVAEFAKKPNLTTVDVRNTKLSAAARRKLKSLPQATDFVAH